MSGDRCALVRVRQRGTSVYDRPASVFRAEGGPTLGLTCAAGGRVKRHGWWHETNNIKRHGFGAAPAASGAGHVGPLVAKVYGRRIS